MKQILIIFLIFLFNISYGQVHVRGYYRKNGTYVQPHERTRPNSTVTDNYSYPGNYNPNKHSTTPTPSYNTNYNTTNSSPTNSNGKTWVNGYYRNDGTYVNGYYRNSTNNSTTNNSNYSNNSNNNYSTPKYQYVKTKRVNVRMYPSSSSELYGTMDWNQSVKTINTYDNWTQIEFTKFNNYTNSYENKTGYIKTNLLNDTYNTEYKEELSTTYNVTDNRTTYKKQGNNYVVTSYQAFFHTKPDTSYIRKAYLLNGEKITSLKESNYYIYIIFRNVYGQTSKGWIRKDDLERQ